MAASEPGKVALDTLPHRERHRPRIDWSARARGTILDAERYSRFVAVMKRMLPIGAGLVIMAVVAYSLVPRPADRGIKIAYDSIGTLENDLAMIRPRLTGTDQKGNPFVVTADSAVQDAKHARRARLRRVEADMTLDKSRWLNATAESGFIDSSVGKLALSDGIAAYTDSGFELHTRSANIDLNKAVVAGQTTVTGQGPLGSFIADEFVIDSHGQQIHLYGNVHMTIFAGRK